MASILTGESAFKITMAFVASWLIKRVCCDVTDFTSNEALRFLLAYCPAMFKVMSNRRRDQFAARRLALGFSQESLSEAIGVSPASVARWEQGLASPRGRHRGPLAAKLQVTLPELDRILDGDAVLNGHAVPAWMSHYVSLEQGAARLQTFEPITMPGLLQTARYSEAVMRTSWLPLSKDVIQQRVAARIARQAVLDRQPEPLELCAVIDESVLRRVTGGPAVMSEQLDHLVRMAQRPTVQLQLVPLESPALHTAAFGSFRLFTSCEGTVPYMVCTEDLTGFNYSDRPPAIETHANLFEHLAAIALPPDQSAELIHQIAERYQ